MATDRQDATTKEQQNERTKEGNESVRTRHQPPDNARTDWPRVDANPDGNALSPRSCRTQQHTANAHKSVSIARRHARSQTHTHHPRQRRAQECGLFFSFFFSSSVGLARAVQEPGPGSGFGMFLEASIMPRAISVMRWAWLPGRPSCPATAMYASPMVSTCASRRDRELWSLNEHASKDT
eukprot:2726807-Rhodomonas_salina.1